MLKILLGIILVYILILSLVYLCQRSFIYFPSSHLSEPKDWQVNDMSKVNLQTTDGLNLESWYKPAKQNKPTIIYFQGNMGHIGHRGTIVRAYLDAGMGVLLVGLRGYGNNSGSPTEQGLYADARAAWNFVKEQGIPNNCIVVFGESIGGALAIQLAYEKTLAALILQSPFVSLAQLGFYHYPIFPINVLLKDRFDNDKKIKKINIPLLMLIASADRIVPPRMSKRLFTKANHPKAIKIYPGFGHNDIHFLINKDVIEFIKKNVKCTTSE